MANVDNPHGLYPLFRTLDGGCPRIQNLSKAASYGTAIFHFDAVFRVADGTIDKSGTPGNTPYSGVALNHGAASTLTEHIVIVSPQAMYEAQDEGTGFAAADMGLNANLVLGAGDATTKVSKHEVDGATKATTATLDVHVLEKLAEPNNDYDANVRLVIVFNKHRMAPATAGV